MRGSRQRDGVVSPGMKERAHGWILRVVHERLPTREAGDDVVSLAHQEYDGRNVVSIVARDEYDDLEPVTYYDQPLFTRRRAKPGEAGTTGNEG